MEQETRLEPATVCLESLCRVYRIYSRLQRPLPSIHRHAPPSWPSDLAIGSTIAQAGSTAFRERGNGSARSDADLSFPLSRTSCSASAPSRASPRARSRGRSYDRAHRRRRGARCRLVRGRGAHPEPQLPPAAPWAMLYIRDLIQIEEPQLPPGLSPHHYARPPVRQGASRPGHVGSVDHVKRRL